MADDKFIFLKVNRNLQLFEKRKQVLFFKKSQSCFNYCGTWLKFLDVHFSWLNFFTVNVIYGLPLKTFSIITTSG